MTFFTRRAVSALSLPLVLLVPVAATVAQTAPAAKAAAVPGAMPNDRTMTCEMIASERASINDAVARKTAGKEKSAKVKKGLFGFAKGIATVMVPGAAMLGGGGSMFGSLAAQGASQSASQLLASAGNGPAKPVEAARPSADQAARLARLDSIGTYRQCTA